MENKRGWPGQRRDVYCSQENSRRRSFNKKPPRGSWQPALPSWEKDFCKVVGALDWETLVEMKRFVHHYDNVAKWDDSAGEEAFHNAKMRFLAKIQGLPCDIPIPGPDFYIDEVDWDAKVDQELLMELESRDLVPDTTANKEPVILFGDSFPWIQGFSATGWGGDFEKDAKITPTGWGDFEEDAKITPTGWGDFEKDVKITPTGWGDFEEDAKITPTGWGDFEKDVKITPTSWGDDEKDVKITPTGWGDDEEDVKITPTGWGDDEEDLKNATNSNLNNPLEQSLHKSQGPAKEKGWGDFSNNVDGGATEAAEWPASWENNTSSWNQPGNQKYRNQRGDNFGRWGTWDEKNAKRNHASRFVSSYRTSKFHGDGKTGGYAWREGMSQKKAACF